MNPHLVSRLAAIQRAMMAQHAGGTGLPSAVAGGEREVFLREYLQAIFPSHRRFGTGVVTDPSGALSGQVDIAVEFGFGPSFPMPGSPTGERLLLADTVALIIEVKSNLVSQWDEVVKTTTAVKALRRDVGSTMVIGRAPGSVIPVVAVGYAGHKTVDGLRERLSSSPESGRPDAALVIDSGCYVGLDCTAWGPAGLYALAAEINFVLTSLGHAIPNLFRYFVTEGGA